MKFALTRKTTRTFYTKCFINHTTILILLDIKELHIKSSHISPLPFAPATRKTPRTFYTKCFINHTTILILLDIKELHIKSSHISPLPFAPATRKTPRTFYTKCFINHTTILILLDIKELHIKSSHISPLPFAPAPHPTTWLWWICWHDDVIKWKHFRVTGSLCGEFTDPGEFPTQRPVTRSFDVFFNLRLNKRLSKQPWGWWFETPSWPLWRQCNETTWAYEAGCTGSGRSQSIAVEKGNLPMVKMMIENTADMDVADKQHRNIIHKAAESKNLKVLQYVCEKLVDRGRLEGKINQEDHYLGQGRCFVVRDRDNGVAAFHCVEVERRFINVFRQITRDGGTVDVARYGNTIRSG